MITKIEKKKAMDGLGWFVSAEPPCMKLHYILICLKVSRKDEQK